MKQNLGEAFNSLMNYVFIRYRGCLIERSGGKFIALQVTHDTEAQAKETIDKAFISFANLKTV